jgi:sugar lactone lactonase YvrE
MIAAKAGTAEGQTSAGETMTIRRIRADVALAAHALHGEGPAWDARAGHLLWVDMMANQLHQTTAAGADRITDFEQPVCVAVPRQQGGLALALGDGYWLADARGELQRLYAIAQPPSPAGPIRMNDGKCDPTGRFWAGSMAYDARTGAGSLFRLDPDGGVHEMLDDVTISNGLAWSADGSTMFYIDSPTQRVDAFDASVATGAIGNRRPVVTIPASVGLPDGMTIDDDGGLWVALWGGSAVHRYTPDGRLDTIVNLPCTQVTSCSFGGTGLDELYITTSRLGLPQDGPDVQPHAGDLFRVRPGVTGPAAVPFAG